MNILFFLTPKSELAYIYDDFTLRQTLEKMEYHRYAAIPIIKRSGEYVGTITEGDLLWAIKSKSTFTMTDAEDIAVMSIERKMDNAPVNVNCNIEDLVITAMRQNFVPVIDDNNKFIGIITRKDIIQYCFKKMQEVQTDDKTGI